MRVLITGANGFIAKNLRAHLALRRDISITEITRASARAELEQAAAASDFVFHLAGVNRPSDPAEFKAVNAGFTRSLIEVLLASGRTVPLVYSSSAQAAAANSYGTSKLEGEDAVRDYARRSAAPAYIYRLPNVFGKWCRPNYNSAVATFCHNVARDLPIRIDDPSAALRLVYIDDVVASPRSTAGRPLGSSSGWSRNIRRPSGRSPS
jgi:UDP-2-acetamido-2,6-beta-L-arabino-hexul-4-ose reductase